jgi:hypothetical protein
MMIGKSFIGAYVLTCSFVFLECMERNISEQPANELIKLYGFTKGKEPDGARLIEINHNKKRVFISHYGKIECYSIDDKEKRLTIHSPEKQRLLTGAMSLCNDSSAFSYIPYLTGRNAFIAVLTHNRKIYLYDLFKKTAQVVSKDSEGKKIPEANVICVNHDSTKLYLGYGGELEEYSLPDFKHRTLSREVYQTGGTIKYIFCSNDPKELNTLISVEKEDFSSKSIIVTRRSEKGYIAQTTKLCQLHIKPIMQEDSGCQRVFLVGDRGSQTVVCICDFDKEGIPSDRYFTLTNPEEIVRAMAINNDFWSSHFQIAMVYESNVLCVYKVPRVTMSDNNITYTEYYLSKNQLSQKHKIHMFFGDGYVHIIYNDGTEEKVTLKK